MDFKQDITSIFTDYLAQIGAPYASNGLEDLCIHFFNVQRKLIPAKPYTVLYSKELQAHMSGQGWEPYLLGIEQELVNGEDITPHLSKLSLKARYDDSLLNAWRVHHLHLSNTKRNPTQKFYDRSDHLLFALVKEDTCYFIDVRDHDEGNVFARRDLIRILQNNWPQLLEPYCIKDATGVEVELTDAEIDQLHRVNVNVVFMVDGRVYVEPGMGSMASGDSVEVVEQMDAFLKHLKDAEEDVRTSTPSIQKQLVQLNQASPTPLDFKWELNTVRLAKCEAPYLDIRIVGTPYLFVYGKAVHESQPIILE